jgi:flagellar basal-body rod modification protein FlgD
MMAAAAGIFMQHQMSAGQVLSGHAVSPMDTSGAGTSGTTGTSGTSGAGSSDAGSATISANDFLTLLVTEMQNQDPTADTDPNEYVNQLVQVNSLEQLIDINQTLTTDVPAPAASTTGADSDASAQTGHSQLGLSPAATQAISPQSHLQSISSGHALTGSPLTGSPLTGSSPTASRLTTAGSSIRRVPGNLGVPVPSPASRRVAHALDGRSHAQRGATRSAPSQ